jgi:hypothetical protein
MRLPDQDNPDLACHVIGAVESAVGRFERHRCKAKTNIAPACAGARSGGMPGQALPAACEQTHE